MQSMACKKRLSDLGKEKHCIQKESVQNREYIGQLIQSLLSQESAEEVFLCSTLQQISSVRAAEKESRGKLPLPAPVFTIDTGNQLTCQILCRSHADRGLDVVRQHSAPSNKTMLCVAAVPPPSLQSLSQPWLEEIYLHQWALRILLLLQLAKEILVSGYLSKIQELLIAQEVPNNFQKNPRCPQNPG